MRQEIYAVLLNYIHIKYVCELLSKIINRLYVFRYFFKRISIKKRKIIMNHPIGVIDSIYPKPIHNCEIVNQEIENEYDASIIIPVYNYKDLIKRCINSVKNQKTKYKYEIILVDDGSTDGASEIVDEYSAHKDFIVIHKKNGGIGSARNTGLNAAHGKYIMFVDCDDYVHDNYVEILLSEAYKKDLDLVICGYTLIKERNNEIISRRNIIKSKKNLNGYKENKYSILNYSGLPWNKAFKKSLFKKVRYIDGYWYEDTIIHFLIFPQVKSYSYIEESLYDYFWYEKNFSHVQSKCSPKSLERFWILNEMIDNADKLDLSNDTLFNKVLLHHLGKPLYSGVRDFDDNVKQAVFLLACEIYRKNKSLFIDNTYEENQLINSLNTKDINKWILICNSL